MLVKCGGIKNSCNNECYKCRLGRYCPRCSYISILVILEITLEIELIWKYIKFQEDYDDADDTAAAEIISYSYTNQLDFTPKLNNTNWDAEGLISWRQTTYIFENWADNKVDVYSIPKN
jgi:hypothetical protein